MRRPSGPNATRRIVFLWPGMSAIRRPVDASHRRTVLSGSTLPETRRDPSGLKARAPGCSISPRRMATSRPVNASHKRMLSSRPAMRRHSLAIGADRQVEDRMFMASQHSNPPASPRIVDTNLAIHADHKPPAIPRERRVALLDRLGEDGEDGEDAPRRCVPQTTGLLVQRADPLSIRAVREPLDRFLVPEQYRHFFS